MKKNNQGFVHLVLLFIVIVAILAVVGMVFVKGLKKSAEIGYKVGTTQSEDKAKSESKGLEEELNSTELSDPSKDFSEIDSDISTL